MLLTKRGRHKDPTDIGNCRHQRLNILQKLCCRLISMCCRAKIWRWTLWGESKVDFIGLPYTLSVQKIPRIVEVIVGFCSSLQKVGHSLTGRLLAMWNDLSNDMMEMCHTISRNQPNKSQDRLTSSSCSHTCLEVQHQVLTIFTLYDTYKKDWGAEVGFCLVNQTSIVV